MRGWRPRTPDDAGRMLLDGMTLAVAAATAWSQPITLPGLAGLRPGAAHGDRDRRPSLHRLGGRRGRAPGQRRRRRAGADRRPLRRLRGRGRAWTRRRGLLPRRRRVHRRPRRASTSARRGRGRGHRARGGPARRVGVRHPEPTSRARLLARSPRTDRAPSGSRERRDLRLGPAAPGAHRHALGPCLPRHGGTAAAAPAGRAAPARPPLDEAGARARADRARRLLHGGQRGRGRGARGRRCAHADELRRRGLLRPPVHRQPDRAAPRTAPDQAQPRLRAVGRAGRARLPAEDQGQELLAQRARGGRRGRPRPAAQPRAGGRGRRPAPQRPPHARAVDDRARLGRRPRPRRRGASSPRAPRRDRRPRGSPPRTPTATCRAAGRYAIAAWGAEGLVHISVRRFPAP